MLKGVELPELPQRQLRRSLDFFASRISDPVNKLWFIKTTLERFSSLPRAFKSLPVGRGLAFHFVVLEVLGELIWSPKAGVVSLPAGPIRLLYRTRYLVLAGMIIFN